MKIYILLPVLFCTVLFCNAQDNFDTSRQFNIVHLPEYYKEEGIVFNKSYKIAVDITNIQSRYSPTESDIKKAEEIFMKKYNGIQKDSINVSSYFASWVRQYVGVIDKNNNKNLIVQLINNKNRNKTNRLLGKGWEDNFVIMLADSFYSISKRFKINIDTGEISTEL
jgi:hypothetical protein